MRVGGAHNHDYAGGDYLEFKKSSSMVNKVGGTRVAVHMAR